MSMYVCSGCRNKLNPIYVKERPIAGIFRTVPVWIQLEDACKADGARETCWGKGYLSHVFEMYRACGLHFAENHTHC